VDARRPLLLVDVDGVLNPYAAAACPEGYLEYDLFPDEEPIRLAEVHGSWLRDLAQIFEPTWATGWGNEANRLIAPILGLPRYPAIEFPPSALDWRTAWKLPAIRAFAEGWALAWLDDVITPQARRWAARRSVPTLLVNVDPTIGLTETAVAGLKTWSKALG
jgi:hypothetical protein